MKNPRTTTQDLREAFASIISMILGLLRAHGVRGLVHLPEVWLAMREMKRIAEAFCELFAAWSAATPAPRIAPQQVQAAPGHSMPRVRVRGAVSRRRRARVEPVAARAGGFARPRVRRHSNRDPKTLLCPLACILVSARCR